MYIRLQPLLGGGVKVPLPQAIRESFFCFLFFSVISNEVRNLNTYTNPLQMLHSVQHDSWIGVPSVSDKPTPNRDAFYGHPSYVCTSKVPMVQAPMN